MFEAPVMAPKELHTLFWVNTSPTPPTEGLTPRQPGAGCPCGTPWHSPSEGSPTQPTTSGYGHVLAKGLAHRGSTFLEHGKTSAAPRGPQEAPPRRLPAPSLPSSCSPHAAVPRCPCSGLGMQFSALLDFTSLPPAFSSVCTPPRLRTDANAPGAINCSLIRSFVALPACTRCRFEIFQRKQATFLSKSHSVRNCYLIHFLISG